MKSDAQIQKNVMDALNWDAGVTCERIGVTVQDGIVTLTGKTPNYIEKLKAEKATQKVIGVRGVVEKIEVELPGTHKKDDLDIAKALADQFKWSVQVPDESVSASVENGWVYLSGQVVWDFQRAAAEDCVKCLTGVRGLTNNISIKPKPIESELIRRKIEEALKRDAEQEARSVQIVVDGNRVILSGNVRSYREMEDIKLAAWCAPGIIKVENKMQVLV